MIKNYSGFTFQTLCSIYFFSVKTLHIKCHTHVKLNHELNLTLWSHFASQVTTSEIVFGIKIENVMTSERHAGKREIYEEKITSLFLVR